MTLTPIPPQKHIVLGECEKIELADYGIIDLELLAKYADPTKFRAKFDVNYDDQENLEYYIIIQRIIPNPDYDVQYAQYLKDKEAYDAYIAQKQALEREAAQKKVESQERALWEKLNKKFGNKTP